MSQHLSQHNEPTFITAQWANNYHRTMSQQLSQHNEPTIITAQWANNYHSTMSQQLSQHNEPTIITAQWANNYHSTMSQQLSQHNEPTIITAQWANNYHSTMSQQLSQHNEPTIITAQWANNYHSTMSQQLSQHNEPTIITGGNKAHNPMGTHTHDLSHVVWALYYRASWSVLIVNTWHLHLDYLGKVFPNVVKNANQSLKSYLGNSMFYQLSYLVMNAWLNNNQTPRAWTGEDRILEDSFFSSACCKNAFAHLIPAKTTKSMWLVTSLRSKDGGVCSLNLSLGIFC